MESFIFQVLCLALLPYGGVLFLKLDESFNVIEEKLISNPDSYFSCNKMSIASNQDILISGQDESFSGRTPTIIRLDPDGELLWKTNTETNNFFDSFNGFTEEVGGNSLLANGQYAISKISN